MSPETTETTQATTRGASRAEADAHTSAPDGPARSADLPGRTRARLGVPTLLLGLVLAVLLPTLGLGIVATWNAVSNERMAAEGRLQDTARDIALAIDREITGYTDAMLALAASPAFTPDPAQPDVPALHAEAQRIARQLGITVSISRPDGTRVLHSSVPLGAPLPAVSGLQAVQQVVRTGRTQITNLLIGSISHDRVIGIEVPVLDVQGRVAAIVVAGLEVEQLRRSLQAAGVPSGSIAALTDANNIVVARSDAENARVAGKPASANGTHAFQDRTAGFYQNTGSDSVRRVFAFQKLQAAPGWTAVVGQSAAVFNRAWQEPLYIFGIGAALALTLGSLLALLAARPILAPLRRLAAHAVGVAVTGGDLAAIPPATSLPETRVAELESLRLGFAAAETTLRRRAQAEREAAAALAEREAQVRALFEASPVGLGRSTFDGRVVEANDILLSILGVTRDDLAAGRVRWVDITTSDTMGVTENAIAEALAAPDKRCTSYEKAFIRPDGTRVPVLINFTVLDRSAGEAAVFVVDLTEARRNEDRLRDLLDTVDLGAFITRTLSGTIRHWSAGCERLYGWTAAEATGRPAQELLETHFSNPLSEIEAELARTGEWVGDLLHRTRDGRRVTVSAHKKLRHNPTGEDMVLEMVTDVTAQRHAEAGLAESEAQLRAIGDASPDIIYSKNVQGRFTYANPAALRHFETIAEAATGTESGALHREKQASEQEREHDLLVMATNQAATFEETVTTTDGVHSYVSTKAPLRDPASGAIIGIAGFSRDVTEQRATDAMKARLAAIVTSTFDAVISFGADDGRILTWNHAAEELFGYTAAEAVGASLHLLAPEWLLDDDRKGVFDAVMQGRIVRDHETVRRTKAGEEIPVSVTAARMQATDGSILGVSAIFRDLRPRYAAEAALRESEARWRTLAESYPGFVAEADAAGRVTYSNSRMLEFTGLSAEALLGDGWTDFIHPDDRDRVVAAWAEAVQTGLSYEAEYRFRAADGTYDWYLCRGMPQRDGRGTIRCWCIASTDISDIVAARDSAARNAADLERLVEARTRELEATQERLAQAAKMEALGRLAGGVAHDFNNVLQAIQGGVALAQMRLKTHADRVPFYLNLASEAAERGVAVTGRLLAFARRGELSAEPVDAVPVLDGLAHILRHTLGPSVGLSVEGESGLPLLLADKAQLETVLVNLANNARDAMPSGVGTIRLTASLGEAPRSAPAHLHVGRYVCLSVTDDGTGMSPEILARVSEPFFTTKPRGAGTGLGLAMARGFAEQSGGALVIESAPGQGTTVSMWLPVAPAVIPLSTGVASISNRTIQPRSVLVVDDEPIVRTVVSTALADQGHSVIEAGDAVAALALLDVDPAVEVLVTDLAMPGNMDGLALIQEARRRRPGLPAVLLTGHTGDAGHAALEAATGTGPFAVLHKPVSAHTLEAKIEALLQR